LNRSFEKYYKIYKDSMRIGIFWIGHILRELYYKTCYCREDSRNELRDEKTRKKT
jgi:hypothetical protein